jgi:hypothetical protein
MVHGRRNMGGVDKTIKFSHLRVDASPGSILC